MTSNTTLNSRIAGLTVLIVYDFGAIRQVARRLLERMGCKVLVASSLAEALPATDFDVALLDMQLPDGEGMDLIEPMRARDQDVGIVMMSGRYSTGLIPLRLRSQAEIGFLAKPFMSADLEAAVCSAAVARRGAVQIRPSESAKAS